MDTLADFTRTDSEYLDVLIVGAGLSGIGAAWHLQDKCPGKSYAILEARETSGGTWDRFRYPGIRSDSDLYTLGYSFRPWKDAKAIADGSAILSYIREVASDHGIDARIRYGHRVVAASWSTAQARWTVEIEQGSEKRKITSTCGFLGCAAATTTIRAAIRRTSRASSASGAASSIRRNGRRTSTTRARRSS
jgi:cation diffusion facilitator CzcD-associated flavoprotein CzcO